MNTAQNTKQNNIKKKTGPVKKAARIQVKAETDYVNDMFPSAAKVLDILRCSLTFESVQALVDTVKYFEKLVETQDISLIKKEASKESNLESKQSFHGNENKYFKDKTPTPASPVTNEDEKEDQDGGGGGGGDGGGDEEEEDRLWFTKITRIKNGFLDISLDHPSYADVKINVVFTDYRNQKSMIAEV